MLLRMNASTSGSSAPAAPGSHAEGPSGRESATRAVAAPTSACVSGSTTQYFMAVRSRAVSCIISTMTVPLKRAVSAGRRTRMRFVYGACALTSPRRGPHEWPSSPSP